MIRTIEDKSWISRRAQTASDADQVTKWRQSSIDNGRALSVVQDPCILLTSSPSYMDFANFPLSPTPMHTEHGFELSVAYNTRWE